MIAAAGNGSENGGNGYIGNPALALNAITVGSTNYFNNLVANFFIACCSRPLIR